MKTRTQFDAEPSRASASPPPRLVGTADADGAATSFDDRWAEYTGLSPAASLGAGWLEAVHPLDRDPLLQAWRTAADDGAEFEVEIRIRREADGVHRRHRARGTPVRDGAGAVAQWVVVLSEIEGSRRDERLERMVRERTVDLRRSNAELERFAAVAAHDLQEPLRKILAFGDRLAARSGPTLDAQGRDNLDRIVAAAVRMRELIDGLMDLSRVDARGRPFPAVDLGAVVADVVADLDDLVARTGGRVEVGPLPTIRADRTQMRQLFQNLIGNALKFHPPGRGSLVRLSSRVADDGGDATSCWVLEVADDGIGFDEAYGERIFQPFERLNGREAFEGAGMGLAICRKIVDRHSGRLTAVGAPGGGSTFRVALPLEPPIPGSQSHDSQARADHDADA